MDQSLKTKKINNLIKDFSEIDRDESLFVGLQNKTHEELCDIIADMARAIIELEEGR